MPRKKQDRPKRSESEIPLDLTVKKSDDDIDPIKLSEPRSSSISPGIVSLSIFVSPNPKGNKTPTQANAPTTTTISRVSGSVNNFKSSGNSKSTSKTLNNVIHSSSSVKHSTNNGNDSRSTKEGTLSGPASGSGGGANRQNPWQTQWINRSSEQNRDVFTCVWCKDSFRCLAEMTQHMKASPRCGMAGMQQATNTVAPGLTSTTSNSLLSSSSSSSSSSSNSLTTNTTTTSTTGTYPLIVPSIAGLAASSTASRSTTPTSIGTGTSTNKGKSNVDLRESLSTPSTPSSMKSSSSISPSLHHPNQVHHHSSSSPNQGPTNSNSDSNNSNLPNQNSTKEPMSSSVLAKNSVNLPRKLVRGQDVWLGRGAEQTRQILKFDHKDECYDDEQGKAQEEEE